MKTSYFANIKNLGGNLVPISISAMTPSWVSVSEYKKLAPTFDILMKYKQEGRDKEEYVRRFNEEVLSKLDPQETYDELICSNIGYEPVLLCYERPGEFCHRRLVAKWFEDNLKIKVEEFKKSSSLQEFF